MIVTITIWIRSQESPEILAPQSPTCGAKHWKVPALDVAQMAGAISAIKTERFSPGCKDENLQHVCQYQERKSHIHNWKWQTLCDIRMYN